jgi:2-hydroxychromene-2-carboxylate isomerase
MRATDRLQRRTLPSTVITLSQLDGAARLGAAARRRTGRRGQVELYFAFDDAASAVAVIGVAERVAGRDVRLLLRPVVERGIPDDPAVDQKRAHAIVDARRRADALIVREEPLSPDTTAFLAQWAAAAPPSAALTRFCVDAMRRLWVETDGPVDPTPYAELWRSHFDGAEPDGSPGGVRANERAMARRKPYDTPAAWIHGQWFFAHDRLPQIGMRLDDLGWTA